MSLPFTPLDEAPTPPACPRHAELHLYLVNLPATNPDALLPTLSDDERARADRYGYPQDRARYVAARGLLRTFLAGYLAISPRDVHLVQEPRGKPYLSPNPLDLHFNLSHAGPFALFGFTRGFEIGVDIELPRAAAPAQLDGLIASQLTPAEAAALRAAPPETRPATFLTYWTCKEALAKARGAGLSLPLNQIDLSVTPDGVIVRAPALFRGWSLVTLQTEAWSAAIASPSPFETTQAWQLFPRV